MVLERWCCLWPVNYQRWYQNKLPKMDYSQQEMSRKSYSLFTFKCSGEVKNVHSILCEHSIVKYQSKKPKWFQVSKIKYLQWLKILKAWLFFTEVHIFLIYFTENKHSSLLKSITAKFFSRHLAQERLLSTAETYLEIFSFYFYKYRGFSENYTS